MSPGVFGSPLKRDWCSDRCFGAVVLNKRARRIFRSGGLGKTVTRQAKPGIHSPSRSHLRRVPSVGRPAAVYTDRAFSCEGGAVSCLCVLALASCSGSDLSVLKKCQLRGPVTFHRGFRRIVLLERSGLNRPIASQRLAGRLERLAYRAGFAGRSSRASGRNATSQQHVESRPIRSRPRTTSLTHLLASLRIGPSGSGRRTSHGTRPPTFGGT